MMNRELRRSPAIEAVIGHLKSDGHLGRCYLKGREGGAANVILTSISYNLRLVLAWMRMLHLSNHCFSAASPMPKCESQALSNTHLAPKI
jgi:hypothetical protein